MILAATNKLAEAFGQTATHAPQPIHVAESNAQSASYLLTNCELASGAEPTDTEILVNFYEIEIPKIKK